MMRVFDCAVGGAALAFLLHHTADELGGAFIACMATMGVSLFLLRALTQKGSSRS
jgi:hypothetical protein